MWSSRVFFFLFDSVLLLVLVVSPWGSRSASVPIAIVSISSSASLRHGTLIFVTFRVKFWFDYYYREPGSIDTLFLFSSRATLNRSTLLSTLWSLCWTSSLFYLRDSLYCPVLLFFQAILTIKVMVYLNFIKWVLAACSVEESYLLGSYPYPS